MVDHEILGKLRCYRIGSSGSIDTLDTFQMSNVTAHKHLNNNLHIISGYSGLIQRLLIICVLGASCLLAQETFSSSIF